jgi:hypothetical protein
MKTNPNTCCKLAWNLLAITLLLGVTIASNASSTIIMSYNAGSNGVPAVAPDPTSVEGGNWNLTALNIGENMLSEGLSPDPVHPDLNTWRTLDNLTTAGAARFSKVPTDEQVTNAMWYGWKASAYLRYADPVPGNAGTITILFQFGSTNSVMNRRYLVYPEINANGALYVSWVNGSITVITNTADALDYHLYEIVYDNATRTAELRVDGEMIHSNWPSLTIPASVDGCLWGVGSTPGRGDGYFNQVKVEVNNPTPTTVTLNPASANRNVAEAHTFVAGFMGGATNLQWYKDGAPISGANQRSYSIANLVPSDGGVYKMGIADPQTGTEVFTADATLTINPDSTPPTVVSVQPLLSLQHIRVTFSEGIDPGTAQNPANYGFGDDALTVTSVTLADLITVVLQTSEQVANSNYNLIISGIQDQSANTMLTVTQALTSANLVPVVVYNAGLEGNPLAAPDPSSAEGGRWTHVRGTNELLSAAGFSPDGASGLNAWNITDMTPQAGQFIDYRWSFPKESHEFARTNGWRYRVRSRMVDDFNAAVCLNMIYGDSTGRRYLVFFDWTGIDVDLTVQLGGGITTNLTGFGAGAADYHLHEIVFDPATQRASYYFDGMLIYSGWNGDASAAYNGPLFGAASSAGQGSMNYNLVEFSVNNANAALAFVTDPTSTEVAIGSSVTLEGLASGFVGGYQWYKDGSPVAGATARAYTIASVTEEHQGDYTVRVFNSTMEVESTTATLAVIAFPELSIDAANGNVTVSFTDTLQSATSITGTFTDVDPQPTSPLILTNPPGSLFFRSRK